MTRGLGYFGLGLLAALWFLPLSRWFGADFPHHMLRHMGLVAVVAPLLVLGFPKAVVPLALSPLLGAVAEFVVVWGWHLPALHGWARDSWLGLVLEQGSFGLAGLLVWAGCLRGDPLAGAGGLLLTTMHMTLLGALIILAPRDLYAEVHARAADLGAQQLGGLLMLGIGTPIYLVAGLALVGRALSDRREVA